MMVYPELTEKLFNQLRELIYDQTAISLSERKFSLVQSRLQRRLKALHLDSFDAYYKYVSSGHNNDEIALLIDAISTNVTSFFREEAQWVFLENNKDQLLQWYRSKGKLRIWSAACSSGQEPYSIAMFLLEHLPNAENMDIKILATDISGDILRQAIAGRYNEKDIGDMSAIYREKYFTKEKKDGQIYYQVIPKLKQMITFRLFNLTRGDFSLFHKTDLDFIFCRNVMIYFDTPTKLELFENFHYILRPNTWFFLGHSESMTGDMMKHFRMKKPSIYTRI